MKTAAIVLTALLCIVIMPFFTLAFIALAIKWNGLAIILAFAGVLNMVRKIINFYDKFI